MSILNTVLLIIHLFIALAIVGVVLMQKSEGGALGIGGGGGGMLTGRGKANLLTRVTAALAGCFFATSILLTIVGQKAGTKGSILDRPAASQPGPAGGAPAGGAPAGGPPAGGAPAGTAAEPGAPAPAAPAPAGGGILDKLK